MGEEEFVFTATPEKDKVSALLMRPENATHLLLLGHGASTNMRHSTMQSIAEALAERGIATFLYKFPYSEKGRGRDSQATCTETIRSAVRAAREACPDLPVLAGGQSFGGRMTTTAQAESPLENVDGLILFSFPLHLAGRPDTKRAEHLAGIKVPMLFMSGTDWVRSHAAENYKFPVVIDKNNVLAHKLGAAVTPEVYYVDAGRVLVYHGAIDNHRGGTNITEPYLRSAFDLFLAGQKLTRTTAMAFGCGIKRVAE